MVLKIKFLEKEECKPFKENINEYYSSQFDKFCSYGRDVVAHIENGVENFTFEKSCISTGKLILINNAFKVQMLFYCAIIVIYLISILCIVLKEKKR